MDESSNLDEDRLIYTGELIAIRVNNCSPSSQRSPYEFCRGTNNSTGIRILEKTESQSEAETQAPEKSKNGIMIMKVATLAVSDSEVEYIRYGDTVALMLTPNDEGEVVSCCVQGGMLYWRECEEEDPVCHFVIGGGQAGEALLFDMPFVLQNAETLAFVSTWAAGDVDGSTFKLLQCSEDDEDGGKNAGLQFICASLDPWKTQNNEPKPPSEIQAEPTTPPLPPETQSEKEENTQSEKEDWAPQTGALPKDFLETEDTDSFTLNESNTEASMTDELNDPAEVPASDSEVPQPPETTQAPQTSPPSSDLNSRGKQEINAVFETGPLGVTLRRTLDGRACFRNVQSGGRAQSLGIQDGDVLVEVNGLDLRVRSLAHDDWAAVIGHIQQSGYPLKVAFYRPASSRRDQDDLDHLAAVLAFPSIPGLGGRRENFILNNGKRRLLHSGDIQVLEKRQMQGLFSSTAQAHANDRILFLFDDLIVLARPLEASDGRKMQVEFLSEIYTIKLNLLPEMKSAEGEPPIFELLTGPTGASLVIKSPSLDSRLQWLTILRGAIINAFKEKSLNLASGWEHHVIVGTAHSGAILGDTQMLMALHQSNMLEVDEIDSERRTPLHYAVLHKNAEVVQYLLALGADVNLSDQDGRTPVHLAALLLQDSILALLLSKIRDVNIQDNQGCTPLHLAVVRKNLHRDSIISLKRCVNALNAWGANSSIQTKEGYSCFLQLAKEWQHEELEALLECQANANEIHSASGGTALHLACHPPLDPIDDGTGSVQSEVSHGRASVLNFPSTLEVLLRYGCPPNSLDRKGRKALQLLTSQGGSKHPIALAGIKVLVSYGAQFNDEAFKKDPSLKALVGLASGQWQQKQCPDAVSTRLARNLGVVLEHEQSLEGRGEKLKCKFCHASFNMISRKHHCRICAALVCHKCSSKEIKLSSGSMYRSCDGCFNAAVNAYEVSMASKGSVNKTKDNEYNTGQQRQRIKTNTGGSPQQDRLTKWLFGGNSPKNNRGRQEVHGQHIDTSFNNLDGVIQGMQQGFQERGEQLSQLSQKTEQLKDASAQFEEMARALNSKSRSWW